ncbi:MAG TPA: HAMP domain-containing sensor histidine kinase [Candidatus Limnocylindrales bacterium]|nr:HAMP domain-containing sensor histidine kinase [Candidatus Limnocylindrales bacterium]
MTGTLPPFRPSDFGIGRLFSEVSDAIIVGDIETGTIVLWNRSAEVLFGYPADEVVGRPLTVIVAESLRAQHEAGIARYRTFRKGALVGRRRPVEVVARARGGREFPVELTLSRIEGDERHLLAIVRDISDRQAVRDAHELEQQRREFFGSAAHELRTPLAAVSAYLQLAERRLRSGKIKEAADTLASGRRRIEQMTHLIDDLLAVSQLDAGRFDLRRAKTDLRGVLGRALDYYSAEHPGRIALVVPDTAVVADVDAERVQQVIDNLVTNALKYGADKPVEIDLREHHGIATIRVRDHGIGVPEEDRPQLFMAFFRTSNTVNMTGTGLGLFISRRIAELHGGRLYLESGGPDGSVFTFDVPLEAAAGPARDDADAARER